MIIPQIVDGSSSPRIPSELSALLLALQLRDANAVPLRMLSDTQWRNLVSFCSRSQLTLLLARIDATNLPLWVVEQLDQNMMDNSRRSERIKATYNEATAALNSFGVPHLVLKGFTQVPHYAPALSSRSQSDIDMYCPPSYLQQAKTALESIGYVADRVLDYSNADHLPTMARKGEWKWRGNHFDPDMPLSIELHFSLWNSRLCLTPFPEIDQFWERRQVRQHNDFKFNALDPVDQLAYFSLHILRNLIFGQWVVHHVFELANFLHKHADNAEFWKKRAQTHTWLFRAHQAVAFAYARSWFNCNVPTDVELEISMLSPAVKHWLDLYIFSSLEGMFHENKDWVLLNASLISSKTQRYTWLRRTLFPQRMPRRNAPAITFKNRQPRSSSTAVTSEALQPVHRFHYVRYVLGRIPAHAFVIIRTFCKGLLWWLTIPRSAKMSLGNE
jgi:hypothetical protein